MKIIVEIDGQTYTVDIVDTQARPIVAMVEDERYEIWPESESSSADTAPKTAAPAISIPEPTGTPPLTKDTGQSAGAQEVAAPLPGVIVAILANPGDSVTRGQELCTLEAMKMKNAIRANRDGTIASVEVAVGDQVNHGQILLTYTD